MRVLIVGKDTPLLWPQHVTDACAALGHETEIFLFNNLGWMDGVRSIAKKFNTSLSEQFVAKHLEKKLQKFKPDVVLFISAFFIPASLYEAAANYKNAKLIAWSGDAFDISVDARAKLCDKLYCTDSHFVELALSFGWQHASYLPLAFNEKIFYPPTKPSRNDEIVFIGNPDKHRSELVGSVGSELTLIGPQWKQENTPQHKVLQKTISIGEVANLYRGSLGVLNIKQGSNVVNGLNMRSFEAAACGALLIHDDVADLKKEYNTQDEVVVFENSPQLNEIVKRIKDESERFTKIARLGQVKAWDTHTYTHRLRQVFNDFS